MRCRLGKGIELQCFHIHNLMRQYDFFRHRILIGNMVDQFISRNGSNFHIVGRDGGQPRNNIIQYVDIMEIILLQNTDAMKRFII